MTKPTQANYLTQIAAFAAMTSDQLAVVPPGELTAWLAVVAMLGVSDPTMDGAYANLFGELSLRAKSAITNRAIGATPIVVGSGETVVLSFLSRPEFSVVGAILRMTAMGLIDKDVNNVAPIWRVRIGGVVVAQWSAQLGISVLDSQPFALTADTKVVTSTSAWGIVSLTGAGMGTPTEITAAVAVDLTVAQTVELTCDSGGAGCSWTVVAASTELLRP